MTTNSFSELHKPEVQSKPLWDIINGIVAYPAIVVAYDLKLFELLKSKSLTFDEITEKLNLENRPAEAMLGVNTSLGLLELSHQKYSLSILSQTYLLEESSSSLCTVMSMLSTAPFASSIESLKNAITSNKAQTYGGDDIFKSHEDETEHARKFTRAMHSISMGPAFYWPDIVNLENHETFLDIAGGSGAHSIGVLKRWNQLNATVLDIAPVCDVTNEYINQYRLNERMNTKVGDMWKTPFPDADVHFYSQIYHDWYFEKCEFLTKKSFESLPSGGKLILHEVLFEDEQKTIPFAAAASSTAMLRWTEGKQYSKHEITTMLKDAGFIDINIKLTGFDYWSLVVATKP